MTRKCRYCGKDIYREGGFWVTRKNSAIPEANTCQSPESPDFRHLP